MKNLKFLFVAVLLTCFVGITQSNAQADIEVYEDAYVWVTYEVDGVMVSAWAHGVIHIVYTPGGSHTYTFQGVLPDDAPLPESAYKADYNLGTVLVSPSGQVTISQKIKKPKD